MKPQENFLAFLFNLEKQQLFQEICFRRFKKYEQILMVLLMVSIMINVLEENYFFETNFTVSLDTLYSLTTDFETAEPNFSLILRVLNMIITFLMIIVLIIRKKTFFLFLKSIQLLELTKLFQKSSSFFWLCVEIVLISIQTYPNMIGWVTIAQREWEIIYLDDTILTFLSVVIKMFFLIRCLIYMSKYTSPKAIKICFEQGGHAGSIFTLKSEFNDHLKVFAAAFLVFIILNNGILLRLCERSAQIFSGLDWDYVWNSFWCIIVTMTTVGYGDILPTTDFGRIIVGLTALLGSLVTSMVCIIFMIEFSFSKSQENAYERIKATECTLKLNHSAGKCIGLAARFFLQKKIANEIEKDALYDEFFVDIKKNVKDFRFWKKIIVDFKYNKKIERRLVTISEDINEHLDELGVLMTYTNFIKSKIDLFQQNQQILRENLDRMEEYHQVLIDELNNFSSEHLKDLKPLRPFFKADKLDSKSKDRNSFSTLNKLHLNVFEQTFSEFSNTKARSSLLKTSKNDNAKFLQIAMKIGKQVSLKKSPRKSILSESPLLKNMESIPSSKLKLDETKTSDKKLKKFSILSKKKTNLKGLKKNSISEKSMSSKSSKQQYPSFDAISNSDFNNFNFFDQKEQNIRGAKILEQEEKDEMGECEK